MVQSQSSDVVITGIGVVSPIGIGPDAFWQNLSEGRCGFRRSELLSYVGTPGCIGGEVSEFNDTTAKKDHLKSLRKSLKVMCREIQLGVASAIQAMGNAGLSEGSYPPDRVGVDFGANLMSSPPEVLLGGVAKCLTERNGTECFDFSKWGEHGLSGMEPLWLLRYLPNMPGCHIGIALQACGPNNSITHDEASGGLAINEAANIIRRGRADVMITGTTGTRWHVVKAAQHQKWDALADGAAGEHCRPFDRDRTGEFLSEASCTLILESKAHAEARGARILATLLGSGSACVAASDGSVNEQKAVELAASVAMKQANVTPDQIGHVSAAGSGHPERDLHEARAIRQLFGSQADKVPVTACKSYFGSAGSGSSLCELAASVLALQHGLIPKTLNFETPDPQAPLNVVHGEHQPTDNRVFLKTSVTRMGQASAVVIGV
ncbi:MAG: beta-ketoacyl-[acyl-carrier-protein] synthase family protein [Planctomycetaceae bacterium]